jgi:Tfp pilus assembly protein PilX
MKNTLRSHAPQAAQRGVVLISAILLLVVMTLLALAMFRSFGIQELIAGNVREKQRALQSAESAAQYAELWLTAPGNILTNSVDCSTTTVGLVGYSATAVPYVCMKPVALIDTAGNVTSVPWKISGAEVGFTFFPGANTGAGSGGTSTGDMIVSATGILNSYYQAPRFVVFGDSGFVSDRCLELCRHPRHLRSGRKQLCGELHYLFGHRPMIKGWIL